MIDVSKNWYQCNTKTKICNYGCKNMQIPFHSNSNSRSNCGESRAFGPKRFFTKLAIPAGGLCHTEPMWRSWRLEEFWCRPIGLHTGINGSKGILCRLEFGQSDAANRSTWRNRPSSLSANSAGVTAGRGHRNDFSHWPFFPCWWATGQQEHGSIIEKEQKPRCNAAMF